MSSFFVRKYFGQLLCAHSLGLYFFGKKKLAQKLRVKCRWNWLLFSRFLFSGIQLSISSDEYKRIPTNIRFSNFIEHIRNFEYVQIQTFSLFEFRIWIQIILNIYEYVRIRILKFFLCVLSLNQDTKNVNIIEDCLKFN